MTDHANSYPEWVIHAVHTLWPASTGRQEPASSYGGWDGDTPSFTRRGDPESRWFAMGCTYTPRQLLGLALPAMEVWEYGQVDMGLSRLARDNDIPVLVVSDVKVIHLHFTEGDQYLDWIVPE